MSSMKGTSLLLSDGGADAHHPFYFLPGVDRRAYDTTAHDACGFLRTGKKTRTIKPDLAAPGVNVISVQGQGGYAALQEPPLPPFAAKRAALLMEWGNDRKNDPFLWKKAKAYLEEGARQLPGFEVWLTISSDTGRFVCRTASGNKARDCKHFCQVF